MEVKKLLDLKVLADKLPDGFANTPRVTRNPLPGTSSTPISVHLEKSPIEPTRATPKHSQVNHHTNYTIPSESKPLSCTPVEQEYVMTFVHDITIPESDPLTLDHAKSSPDWPKWLIALQAEYNFLRKHQVFGPLVTILSIRPIDHKLVFVKKRNAQKEIVRYKVWLVA